MLWLVLKVVWGPLHNEENKKLADCSPREAFVLATLSIFVFATGFLSTPLLAHTEPTIKKLQQSVSNQVPFKTELVIQGQSDAPLKVMME